MKITAVIVTYNRRELLERGINCLRGQSRRLDNIIVVDNGATDGTHEWLDSQPDLEVIHQDNVGGSGGFYTGIRKAYEGGYDWIWCMDDDVFPQEECLENLIKVAETEGAGIVAPHRKMGGTTFTHEFRHYDFSHPFASMHGRKLKNEDIDHAKEPSIPIVGCDFEGPFIQREVVEKIGLPNRELFIFCDDTDYCLRAHLAGFKLVYAIHALMDKHKFFNNDTWTTRNQKKKWKRYYQVRNEAYLNYHYGRNWGVRYLRSFIGVIGYTIPAICSMPFTKAWQWKDLGMLWGAYQDGIHERLGKRK